MEKRERVEDDASTEPSKRIKVEAGLSPLIQPSGQPLAQHGAALGHAPNGAVAPELWGILPKPAHGDAAAAEEDGRGIPPPPLDTPALGHPVSTPSLNSTAAGAAAAAAVGVAAPGLHATMDRAAQMATVAATALDEATVASAKAAQAAAEAAVAAAERNKWRYDPFLAAKKMREETKSQLTAAKEKCNCKHSKCLKLYCECFRRGEYCSDCNCKNCTNNVDNEGARRAAVFSSLERDANAFRSKIAPTMEDESGSGQSKGCKCARSKCLKRYCECFQAGALCTDQCKCTGCKNTTDSKERAALVRMARKHRGGAAGAAADAAAKKVQCPPSLEADAIETAASRMVAAALEKQDEPLAAQEEAVLAAVGATLQSMIETLNGTRAEEPKVAGAFGSADKYFAAVEAAAAKNGRRESGGARVGASPASGSGGAAAIYSPAVAISGAGAGGVVDAGSPPGNSSKTVARRL